MCRYGFTPLMMAAREGSLECMQLILAAHDPTAKVTAVNQQGRNALIMAAIQGKVECVELLLDQPRVREQLQAADEAGWTALMWAARLGHVSCIQAMLGVPEPSLPSALVMAVSRQHQTSLCSACSPPCCLCEQNPWQHNQEPTCSGSVKARSLKGRSPTRKRAQGTNSRLTVDALQCLLTDTQ